MAGHQIHLMSSPSLCIASLLLVQLIGALLELLLAGRLAKVVGDDGTGVGLVVLESCSAAASSLRVRVVKRVRRRSRVFGLLCDLVGDAYSSVSHAFIVGMHASC
jgi:hypothetical protein